MVKVTDKGVEDIQGFNGFRILIENAFKLAFGNDINLETSSPQRQLVDIFADLFANIEESLIFTINQLDPRTATGNALDGIFSLYGGNRRQANPTTVQAVVTGVPRTQIPIGSRAITKNGDIFKTSTFIRLDTNGRGTVGFESVKKEPIVLNVGDLNRPYDSVTGWETVNNLVKGTAGANVETDAEYRKRITVVPFRLSRQNIESIIANVSEVKGVNFVNGQENDTKDVLYILPDGSLSKTQETNSIEILPNSIYILVDGGDDRQIAEVISDTKTGGTGMTGDVVVDIKRYGVAVRFNRYTVTPIKIRLNLKQLEGFPPDGERQIRDNIERYFQKDKNLLDSMDIEFNGNSVYNDDLYSVINIIKGSSSNCVRIENVEIAEKSGTVYGKFLQSNFKALYTLEDKDTDVQLIFN